MSSSLDFELGGGLHADRGTTGRLGTSTVTQAAASSTPFSWAGITNRVQETFNPETEQGRANVALFGSVLDTAASAASLAANYQQQKDNANYIRAVAQYNLDRQRVANSARLSSQIAAQGGRGMKITRGSPVVALVNEAYWMERDAYARAHSEFERAKVIKREAKRELIRGSVAAGFNLLGAGLNAGLGGGFTGGR